jgi:hypothetical protein
MFSWFARTNWLNLRHIRIGVATKGTFVPQVEESLLQGRLTHTEESTKAIPVDLEVDDFSRLLAIEQPCDFGLRHQDLRGESACLPLAGRDPRAP